MISQCYERRVFCLSDGWELVVRTAPFAMGREGSAPFEITLWQPESTDPDVIRTGMSYSGDSWRECFRRLRDDQREHGWTSARWV